MFPEGMTFFLVPQDPIKSGVFQKLSRSSQSVYIALLYLVQQKSKRHFTIEDSRLSALCGVSHRTMHDVRGALRDAGLFSSRRGKGGVYWYTVLDPRTGSEFIMPPRKPRADAIQMNERAEEPTTPPLPPVSGVRIDRF